MSRLIDTGLEQLTQMLVRMGDLAKKTVSLSIMDYIEGKSNHGQVQEWSDMLIMMEDEVEAKAFELIARFQPVASDLRIIKSYIKISYDFTRYGRYAHDISQICKMLGGMGECEEWIKKLIREMSERTLSMVDTSVESLKNLNAEVAKTLSETENKVDNLYTMYFERLVKKAPSASRCTISSVLVVRYLERIADHATYTGESVVYVATGEKVTLR
jgi:phosphate transport system protein